MVKKIKGFDDLFIDDCGTVRNSENKILKTRIAPNGYIHVYLKSKTQKGYEELVHRLVAEAFVPNPDNLPEINHLNHIKTDNRAGNLEWCTHQYNIEYSLAVPIRCFETGEQYVSLRDAARKNHISPSSIHRSVHQGFTAGGKHYEFVGEAK